MLDVKAILGFDKASIISVLTMFNWLIFNTGSAADRDGSVDADQISTELVGQCCKTQLRMTGTTLHSMSSRELPLVGSNGI